MSVPKKEIAEHFDISEEDVICKNCAHYDMRTDPCYCDYWELDDSQPYGYCSFFDPIKD